MVLGIALGTNFRPGAAVATRTNRLSTRGVQTLTKPGRHADGGNLYLNVTKTGGRSWVFFYRADGRMREMGLGTARDISLAEARELAAGHRRSLRAGIDPLTVKRVDAAKPTFGALAEQHIASMEGAWRNTKHRAQWRSTLSTHATALRDIPVDRISTTNVLAVLKPIWSSKPETASRVRGRIAAVLDAAKSQGYREGDNPAAWVGHLKNLLPSRPKLSRGHHAAMPSEALAAFMVTLREAEGVAARALEFTILTVARSGEARGALWEEFDLLRKVWTVPAARMKAGIEHRVPLSDRAFEVLEAMASTRIGDSVFPGAKDGKVLSDMALAMVLRRLHVDVTVHGFRSTFRDWASEETSFPHEVCEMALAHVIKNKAEAAYRRGDLFEKRRELMAAWDQKCKPSSGNVVTLVSTRHG